MRVIARLRADTYQPEGVIIIAMNERLTTEKLRDIVEDSHVNFLVGAGASIELFDTLGDMENALTILSAMDSSDEVKIARASIYAKFFDGVIVKNRDLLRKPEDAESLLSVYRAFLKSINRILLRRRSSLLNKQVNIFTTNVDLVFEVALDQLGLDSNDGFTGKFNPKFNTGNFGSLRQRRSLQYENLSEVPTFNLIKLHGSVGWRPDTVQAKDGSIGDIFFDSTLSSVDETEKARSAARDGLVTIESDEKIMVNENIIGVNKGEKGEVVVHANILDAAEAIEAGTDIKPFMDEYEKLAVVNPTKEKFQTTVLNENYYDLFRIFANEMEKENSVLFVLGFSFRDEHIRKLVVRAARANPTLQVYIFCHTSNQRDGMAKLIDEVSIKNGNIVFIVPGEKVEGEPEERLDLKTITENYFEQIVPEAKRKPDQTVEVVVNMKDADGSLKA